MKELIGSLEKASTAPSPRIACWLPREGSANGAAIIIFPGGGYGGLAPHEGAGYAERFVQEGYCGFVVEYRLGSAGHRHPAMLEDALASVRAVRSRAKEFGISPDRIGVMGSSAGGHLAAHCLTCWHERESAVSLRPDFGILCYPVIDMVGPHTHLGSKANLLGENFAPAVSREVSCDLRVDARTPPCFLWHTVEDDGVPVENSMLFAAALRRHGVPFELHVYEKGGHGLGLGAPFPWANDCLRWLKRFGNKG